MIEYVAKGSRSGGGFKSSSKSSISSKSKSKSSSSSTSKSKTTKKSSSTYTPSKPKVGKSTATPGSKIKTLDGKEVQSSAKKPVNARYSRTDGIYGDNGYAPRFTGGYTPPYGSTVYYPQHSALDYLPWIYLFSQDSPQHDQVTIVQPDGKETMATPEAGGVDGLAVFNWIVLVIMALAIIGGIVWGVNKISQR